MSEDTAEYKTNKVSFREAASDMRDTAERGKRLLYIDQDKYLANYEEAGLGKNTVGNRKLSAVTKEHIKPLLEEIVTLSENLMFAAKEVSGNTLVVKRKYLRITIDIDDKSAETEIKENKDMVVEEPGIHEHVTHTSYAEFVARKIKDPVVILQELSPERVNAIHMILGLSGEVGELLDAVKKWTIYDKQLDLDNVIEELGDIEFFLEGIRQVMCTNRNHIIERNMEKLSKRYKSDYTDKEAVERADKQ